MILGILAVTAIPRFTGMSSSARVAAMNGMLGAVQSASAIVHAQALVENKAAASSSSISMEGKTVATVYGYPDSAAGGLDNALAAADGFTYAAGVYTLTGGSGCTVTYVAPTAANTSPSITAGSSCQ